MAIAFVQAKNNSTVGTATTVTITTTTGNLLVLAVYEGVNTTSTMSVTDSAGTNTWIQAGGYVSSGTDRFAMFYCPNSNSVTSVTATWSGGISATVPVVVIEFSGVATGTPFDLNGANPATGTFTVNSSSQSSGAISTNNANDVLIFALGLGFTTTGMAVTSGGAGAGFTLPTGGTTSNQRCTITYKIVTTVQSSVTTSNTWNTSSHPGASILAAFADTNQVAFVPDEDFFTLPFVPLPDLPVSVW